MTACTLKSGQVFYNFFLLNAAWCSTRLPPHKKKLLCKSHSSLNCEWWAVLTLKPGSEQSLAYIFQEICDSYCGECLLVFFFRVVVWFTIHVYCVQVLSSLVFLLTGACCSLHTTQFFKCYHAVVDKGKPLFNRACSAGILPSLLTLCSFHNSHIQLINLTPARSVYLPRKSTYPCLT